MEKHELLHLLRTDDEYRNRLFKEQIEPVRYGICKLLDFELRPYQRLYSDKIIMSTLKASNEEVVSLQSRQAGKTETKGITVLTLVLFYLNIPWNFNVGWFAPAQSVSIMVARKRIVNQAITCKEYLADFNVRLVTGYGRERVGRNAPVLVFRNDKDEVEGQLRSMSANPRSNIKGDTLDLVIIEDCFPYEAEILTDVGWVEIGSIVEDGVATKVLSYNENTEKLEWNLVSKRMTKYVDNLIKMTYDGGYVVCTPTHKFLTDKGWKEAQDLNDMKVKLLSYDFRANRTDNFGNTFRRYVDRIPYLSVVECEDLRRTWISSERVCKVEGNNDVSRFQNEYMGRRKSWVWGTIHKLCKRVSSIFHESLLEFNKKWKKVCNEGIFRVVNTVGDSSMVYGRWFDSNLCIQYRSQYPFIFEGRKRDNSGILSREIWENEIGTRDTFQKNSLLYQIPLYDDSSSIERYTGLYSSNNASQMERTTSEMCDMFKIIPSFSQEQPKCLFRRMYKRETKKGWFKVLSQKKVFDITVDNNHNFFVRFGNGQPILAHNCQEVDQNKMDVDIFPMASTGAPIVMDGVPIPDAEKMNQYYIETITKNPRKSFLLSVDWKRACAFTKDELIELDAWDEDTEIYVDEVNAYENGSDSYRYYINQYRKYILNMRKRMMVTDPQAFLSQYELKWFTGARKLISLEDIMELEQEYDMNALNGRFCGLDIAKVMDSTVGIIFERYLGEHYLIGLFEREGVDYTQQAVDFVGFLKDFRPLRYTLMDSTGGGELFMDNFKAILYKEPREIVKEIGSWDGFDFRNREEVNRMNQIFCSDLMRGNIHFDRRLVNNELLNKLIEQVHTVDRVYHGHYLWLEAPSKSQHDDYPAAMALARYASEEKSQKVFIGELSI